MMQGSVAGVRSKSKTKKTSPNSILFFCLLSLLLFLFFFVFYQEISSFIHPISTKTSLSHSTKFAICEAAARTHGQRFLFYAPHSGFSNQLSELKNAILMAAILNRTLIVPPVLDHHAVALGSCPKFRVLSANELRLKVWDHAVELRKEGRYMSMAEIIDLSPISDLVRTMDLRDFVSLSCGVSFDSVCKSSSNDKRSPMDLDKLEQCRSLLSGLGGNVENCVYAVDENCRNTVWTYRSEDADTLDLFQPDEQLRLRKKISDVRYRRDVYKTLGPGTVADKSPLLAFGSLFTSPYKGSQLYMDIRESPKDKRIQSLLDKIEFLPFVSAIKNAGEEFAQRVIKSPYLCAQLRLLDGQFKNHWKTTFSSLKEKLKDLKQKGPLPVHIFVMTDLPRSNWSGSYLEELASDSSSFKIHVLSNDDEFVKTTAKKLAPAGCRERDKYTNCFRYCPCQSADVLLYLEEAVCSCASLGFVGTAGSTIAESIELMRKNSACLGQTQTALFKFSMS